jgi:hypothetical protein
MRTALKHLGINRLNLREVLFITGAGISAPDPTQFPLGAELHRSILQRFTNLLEPRINQALHEVPFEASCGAIRDVFRRHPLSHDVDIFWNLVSELFIWRREEAWKQPNELHAHFREHIRNGGIHITANLDQFIEGDELVHSVVTTTSIEEELANLDEQGVLYKFHGDCTRDGVGEQGFELAPIQNGFSPRVQHAWDTLLNRARLVMVCGYGGLDRYDVNPYFSTKAKASFGASILWLAYGDQPLSPLTSSGSPDIDSILSKFKKSFLLKGRSGDALNELGLGLPEIRTMTRTGSYRGEYNLVLDNTLAQYRATFADLDDYKRTAGDGIVRMFRP